MVLDSRAQIPALTLDTCWGFLLRYFTSCITSVLQCWPEQYLSSLKYLWWSKEMKQFPESQLAFYWPFRKAYMQHQHIAMNLTHIFEICSLYWHGENWMQYRHKRDGRASLEKSKKKPTISRGIKVCSRKAAKLIYLIIQIIYVPKKDLLPHWVPIIWELPFWTSFCIWRSKVNGGVFPQNAVKAGKCNFY